MFPFVPMLIGSGIGLLTNRKDPLKGALIGAGLGAAGGGLLGGGASAPIMPVPDGSSVVDLAGTSAAGLTAPVQPGLLDMAKQYKPVFDAAQTGISAANTLRGNDAPPPPPTFSYGDQSGSQALSSIYQQGQQSVSNQLAMADQERQKRRMARRGLMG